MATTIDEAFTEGFTAYHKKELCPYSSGEKKRAWLNGYTFAKEEDNKCSLKKQKLLT